MRPVCAAKFAPNSRVSTFLCQVINDLCDGVEERYEVKSFEEMRSALEEFNVNTSEDERKRCHILSFDVKSLYPSISKAAAEKGVKDLILRSEMEVMNINYTEMSKYLYIMMSQEKKGREKLSEVQKFEANLAIKPPFFERD